MPGRTEQPLEQVERLSTNVRAGRSATMMNGS
jgi:hypothetical protein